MDPYSALISVDTRIESTGEAATSIFVDCESVAIRLSTSDIKLLSIISAGFSSSATVQNDDVAVVEGDAATSKMSVNFKFVGSYLELIDDSAGLGAPLVRFKTDSSDYSLKVCHVL